MVARVVDKDGLEMSTICPNCRRMSWAYGGSDDREVTLPVLQMNSPANEIMFSQGGLACWQAKRVAAFVEAHLGTSFQVGDLARVVQLSTSHFSRAFKKSFGETPRGYVMRQRMHHAQVIMLSSQEPLVKIALDCGMADQSHFSRVFRRVVGVTPAAWRRRFSTGSSPRIRAD